jgi:hypothetical protein
VLAPPLPATMSSKLPAAQPFSPSCAQESFQGTSGMYDFADEGTGWLTMEVGEVSQKRDSRPIWSKSVPPTATLNGVEA